LNTTEILSALVACLSAIHSTAMAVLPDKTGSNRRAPNVILVMTDDQGYGDLSCHGNPILKTPVLDALHNQSVRMTDFHVSPFCTPTRAALMTGRYPGRTGAYRTSSGRTMLHTDERTIANIFADQGYVTGMVGKWHLGDSAPHRPQDRGFQDVVWHRCGGVGQASDFWGNDYFDDTYERNGQFEKFSGYCTDVWFREGMRFVAENKDKPFFLYLALNAPHGPYRVAPKWAKPYKGNKQVANPNFFGMIANIDYNVGILRRRLEELQLAENTILVFMTDNGTAAGAKFRGLDSEPIIGFNAGMRGKKSSIYEGGHRVPCFIHWPGGGIGGDGGGRDVNAMSAHIDMLPTLAELCSIDVPKAHQPDGISFAPLLTCKEATPPRDHLCIQFHAGAGANKPIRPWTDSCVLKGDWRLMNGETLYNIRADPAQRTNIAAQHSDVVQELRELYTPYWESISPRMTPVSIDIGNPTDNPTTLSSQDWYMSTGNPPWNFNSISRLPKVVGSWNVNVRQAGRYRLALRQFPEEANKPLVAVKASVEIAGETHESSVDQNSNSVTFEITVPVGKTQLTARLYNEAGKVGGAYFTTVQYVGK
jgi:arylsulfatase A-like enzyme